jgi:hypothetical protein
VACPRTRTFKKKVVVIILNHNVLSGGPVVALNNLSDEVKASTVASTLSSLQVQIVHNALRCGIDPLSVSVKKDMIVSENEIDHAAEVALARSVNMYRNAQKILNLEGLPIEWKLTDRDHQEAIKEALEIIEAEILSLSLAVGLELETLTTEFESDLHQHEPLVERLKALKNALEYSEKKFPSQV